MDLVNRYNKNEEIKQKTEIILDNLVKELYAFIVKTGNDSIDSNSYIDEFNDILKKYPQFDEGYTELYDMFMISLIGTNASFYITKDNEDNSVISMNNRIIEAMARYSKILDRYNELVNMSQQTIQVNITNNIRDEIKKYQSNTGASKVWIAMKMGYNSPQAFDKAMKNVSNSVETYAKFAYFLGCESHNLYTVEIINKNSL